MLLPRIRVFLTSPGDVADERAVVRTFLQQLPTDPFVRDRATIELVAWDTPGGGTPMVAARTPQASIDAGMARPSECEIVVAMFWGRIGTPLPHPDYARADGTPYESGSVWELEDALDASRRTGRPHVLIYRRLPPAPIDPTQPDADNRFTQFRALDAYFRAFSDPSTGSIVTAHTTFGTPDEFRQRVEIDLRSLTKDLIEGPASVHLQRREAEPAPVWHGSPFPGLRSFTPADAPIFFGRGRETDLLVSRVRACPFVTVIGASGSGKSSVVGAGLVPRLAGVEGEGGDDGGPPWLLPSFDPDTRQWAGIRFTPGELGTDPFVALAARLAPLADLTPREAAGRLAASPDGVGGLLDQATAATATGRVLVFADQFEELFTVVAEEHRDPFVRLLETVAGLGPHRVVVTLRSDFYQRCVERPALARLMENGQLPVAAPTDTLLEMITRPAAVAALTLEEGLAGRLLNDTGAGAGALPLLAFALDELFRHSAGRMTLDAYERIGGVQGAIGVRAEDVFQRQIGPAGRDVFAEVFRELVEIDDTGRPARRRARLETVAAKRACADLVGALTDARLLVTAVGADREPTVEVAHEALFRSWPRLVRLVETQRDDLRLLRIVERAARDWHANGRADSYLWPHERLQPVYEMRDRLAPAIDAVTEAFIQPEHERLLVVLADLATPEYQRVATADRLAIIGARTVPSLVAALEDDDARVRAAAVHALGRIGPPAVPAVAALAGHGDDAGVRLAAVAVLRTVGSADSANVLATLTTDPDQRVRSAAVGALGGLAPGELTAAARRAMTDALGDASVDVRWQAAGALAAFGFTAVPSLVDALDGVSPEAAETAANALLALGPVALPELTARLGSGPAHLREAIARVLVRMGPDASRALGKSSPSPAPDEEWRVVSVLAAIGDRSGSGRAAAALRSPDTVVRASAVQALHQIADPGSLASLLPLLDDADDDVHHLAVLALARLGAVAVDPLVELLSSPRSDRVLRGCRLALVAIGGPAVTRLVAELETPGRAAAELVLTGCGTDAVPALVAALAGDRAATGDAAVRVLVAIGPPAVGPLTGAVGDRSWRGYRRALDVLAVVGGPDAGHLFGQALDDADPEVRATAVRAMAHLGASALPSLTRRLGTADPARQRSVVAACAAVGGPAVPILVERRRDGSARERAAAEAALDRIGTLPAVFDAYNRGWALAAGAAVSR